MKKIIVLFLILISLGLLYVSPVYARAGGGSAGGSVGSSGSSSHHGSSRGKSSPVGTIFSYVLFIAVSGSTVIFIKIKLTKAKIKTKKKMKKTTWNYTDIKKRVEEAYFMIQNAWAKNDMSLAQDYMTPELLENFKIKLDWMEIDNKRNVLKKFKLLKAYPVSLIDDKDDLKDKVWVYIKGKMIDYTIDTKLNKKVKGSMIGKIFIEYWLFSKNEKGKWVLSKILQEDEIDSVPLEI